ncbi:hypothetical protein NFI96_014024, partial [Prochilodus magdalenae]
MEFSPITLDCSLENYPSDLSVLVKKAQQHLYFLRNLKKVHLSPRNFYRCTIESILTNCITV